jgi:hypothetical protein
MKHKQSFTRLTPVAWSPCRPRTIQLADQIGDRGAVIVTERVQLLDRGGTVVAVIDRGVGRAITLSECRIDPRTIVAFLLSLVLPSDFGGGASVSGLALAVVSTAGRSA